MQSTRIETDSLGELNVPVNAYYGIQTQRAINNFPISHQKLPEVLIRTLLKIKSAAALANERLGLIDSEITTAIDVALEETDISRIDLEKILDQKKLTDGGF